MVEHRLRHAAPVDPLAPCVVDRDAVEQHRGASFVDAADRDDLRGAADQAARARQLDGGDLAQEVLRFARRTLLDLLRRQNVDGRRDFARVGRGARRRDDDAREEERAFLERDVSVASPDAETVTELLSGVAADGGVARVRPEGSPRSTYSPWSPVTAMRPAWRRRRARRTPANVSSRSVTVPWMEPA